MIIANPIYDVVFKYLMDEGDIARRFISKILGVEILSLELRPKERSIKIEDTFEYRLDITIYRLDFIGEIKTPTGSKKVMIELQKAWDEDDIHRFRNYLAQEFARHYPAYRDYLNELKRYKKQVKLAKENNELLPKCVDKNVPEAIPIVTIYIINHKLSHEKMILHVDPVYKDPNNDNEILIGKDDFIENLVHNAYFIQIPCIPNKPKNELEEVFSVFNQHYLLETDQTKLNYANDIKEKGNKLLSDMIQTLLKISGDPKVAEEIEQAQIGADYLDTKLLKQFAKQAKIEYEAQENLLRAEKAENLLKDKNKELEGKYKELESKDKELEDKDKELEDKDKVIEDNKKALADAIAMIERMKKGSGL